MQQTKAICFGEVLWDILPAGALPGGAPMNVAYHLNRLGKQAKMISKIGDDTNGEKLVAFMQANKISSELLQKDEYYPTGTVIATPGDNHEMHYDIIQPVAYDFIDYTKEVEKEVADVPYFIFGSLAARTAHSRNTLQQLITVAQTKVLDINLRPPHFKQPVIETLCQQADILKLNENELPLIPAWYAEEPVFEEQVKLISKRFSIPKIIVTKGAHGASYYDGEKFYHHPGFKVKVADTIGSGDSFLAAFLSGMMDGWLPEKCIELACKIGAFVASQKGGCPAYDLEMIEKRFS